jgi:hypothetical protein
LKLYIKVAYLKGTFGSPSLGITSYTPLVSKV